MNWKNVLAFATAACFCMGMYSWAEPSRPLMSLENKRPALHKAEVGLLYLHTELSDKVISGGTIDEETPYVRFGLAPKLTLSADLPYIQTRPDFGEKENGIGDASLGLELTAFEDVFDFPYLIPHVSVSLPTGDEDKGLGTGESQVTIGAAVGTTVEEIYQWVADVKYTLRDEEDDIIAGSAAFIVDLDKQCSLQLETGISNEKTSVGNKPWFYGGGIAYKATKKLEFIGYLFQVKDSVEDIVAGLKAAYSF